MCNTTPVGKSRLLFTAKSFDSGTSADGTRQVGKNSPCKKATVKSILIGVVFLFFTEHLCRYIFATYQHLHPLLEIELNRKVLARHIGVDVLGCATVAFLGVRCRHLLRAFYDDAMKGKNTIPAGAYDQRLFSYVPEGQQIAHFFAIYQVKNTYDTIVFNDGPEFIFHHVLALMAAWGAMYPGCGHVYVIFFMGLSEISTAVLCLLANFDDEFGVVGLGDAFPIAKVLVGVLFVIFFILCRCIIWPFMSYHFARDCRNALKSGSPQSEERKKWLWALMSALCGLSVLQVLWLGQIFVIAQEEIGKVL
jgi:hypothetical protein